MIDINHMMQSYEADIARLKYQADMAMRAMELKTGEIHRLMTKNEQLQADLDAKEMRQQVILVDQAIVRLTAENERLTKELADHQAVGIRTSHVLEELQAELDAERLWIKEGKKLHEVQKEQIAALKVDLVKATVGATFVTTQLSESIDDVAHYKKRIAELEAKLAWYTSREYDAIMDKE